MATRTGDSDAGSMTPSEQSDAEERSERDSDYETDEEEEHKETLNIQWTGYAKKTPVILFNPEAILQKKAHCKTVGERYHLAYKFGNSECKLVRNIFNFHGFHEVHPNSSDFNIIWTGGHLKPFTLRGMTEFQKINHFPRSYELTRKDRLYKNIQRMQQIKGVKHFDFVPQSFILPSEYQDYCSAFLREKGTWIVKPVASSRGRGVFLCNHPDQVPLDENLIVSRYLHNPLLIDNFKFDVRLYVCVTSYDPICIYLFEEGLARFATVKYEKSNRHIRNQCMHLTNYSVNKKSDDYVRNDDPDVEDYGNKWSLGAMLRYLRSHGKDTAAVMMRIEDVIIKTIISVELPVATACKMFMPHRGNCFELYGFDILIDDNLKPWVLEVNLSPSLACDAPLDLKIKTSMLCDLFSLSGLICHDPMMRTLQQSRRNQELASKMAARAKSARYRPSSATVRQRPQSAGASSVMSNSSRNSDRNSSNSNKSPNMAGLTSDEIKICRRVKEEDSRKGGWVRIFPTADTWDLYSSFLQFSTTHNLMLHSRLYPERHAGGSTGSQRSSTTSAGSRARSAYSNLGVTGSRSDVECAESYAQAILRTRQYERKLGTSRTKGRRNRGRLKQRQRHRPKLVQGVAEEGEDENEDEKDDDGQADEKDEVSGQNIKGENSRSSSPDTDNIPDKKAVIEVEVDRTEERSTNAARSSNSQSSSANQQPEKNMSHLPPKPPTSIDIVQRESRTEEKVVEREPVREEPPPPPPQPPEEKYNVVELLHKGHSLSKVQARAAFAMYLVRVQQRLISETTPVSSDETDALNEQMDLVLRFLKRAAINLQQSFKVVVPSRKLPLNDRRRILAKQLGDFVHIYNKETEQLRVKKIQERKQGKIAEIFPGQDGLCERKFERFVNTANEGELEEVLTTYTKINKSASIFLGGNNKNEVSNQSRPSTGSSGLTSHGHNSVQSDQSSVKRRESTSETPPQVVSGWEDVPRVNTATANETKPSASTISASQYHTPSQSSYANAVQIYSQKLGLNRPSSATSRPRSASASSQRPGTSQGGGRPFARPLSAAQSRQLMNNPYATTDPTVDSYNDQAIHDALQRLALRQQARQYSAHNGSTVIPSEEARSRPSTAQSQKTSDRLHGKNNSIGDSIYNNNYSGAQGDNKNKFVTLEDHFSRSRPPSGSGQGQRRTTLLESRGGSAVSRKPVQTNVNLQSANATFNSFIEDSGPHWQNDLALAYNQVTGVLPNNYHTASHSSKQYQLLQQQQALKHQSKAMLEQSKAKHQAMVAQAHAVQKSIQQQFYPADPESAVSKYAPKPPVQPSHTRKLSGAHRVQRPTADELTFSFHNSLKYDSSTGQVQPTSDIEGPPILSGIWKPAKLIPGSSSQ